MRSHRSNTSPVVAAGDTAVRIVHWPAEAGALEALAEAGTPRLLVVDDGTMPPVTTDCCQDWMWRSAGDDEMKLRLRHLALRALGHRRARPHIDELGILHFALRSVPLPPKERRLAALLLDRFERAVTVEELLAAGWPDGVPSRNAVATRISSLRSRVSSVGLEIRPVHGHGYAMRAAGGVVPTHDGIPGFDDQLDREF